MNISKQQAAQLGHPRIPQADPWDQQTGVREVARAVAGVHWRGVSKDWAAAHAYVFIRGTKHWLTEEPIQVARVRSGGVEAVELTVVALLKRLLQADGVRVVFNDPLGAPANAVEQEYKYQVTLGARYSVAVVPTGGGAVQVVGLN